MKAEAQAGVLAGILDSTARSLAARSAERPQWERRAARAPEPPSFAAALASGDRVAVIAEIKRRSPSAGRIFAGVDAVELAARYAEGGAAAISVLTEEAHFGGSREDLERVASISDRPVLRKDFILDPMQLYEARALGAAAVLLIARALERDRLAELVGLAHRLGLATLLEIHTEPELASALALRPTAVGINARDLDTLVVERGVASRLLPRVPPDLVSVAESGIQSRADVEALSAAGADAVLVGTWVAGAADPAGAVRSLTGVPRSRRGSGPR